MFLGDNGTYIFSIVFLILSLCLLTHRIIKLVQFWVPLIYGIQHLKIYILY